MSLQYQTDEQEQPQSIQPGLPFPVYTVVLIASYATVAAVQFAVGLDRSIMLAGFDKPAFLHGHEYWRILTGATLHGGLLHVVMNSYAFFSFGRIFEMLTNRAHLAIVFLFSAIGGGLLSLAMLPDGVSVGASGGIVGLIGYLVVYAFRRREFISYEFRKSLLINIGFILIFGLLLYQTIDNYGHIGGLITGAVYGLLQVPGDSFADPRVAGRAAGTIGLISVGVYVAACSFSILLMSGIV
ncbi:MAG: rhomboid family intramembrane serine protease [Pyrinomonadaceae bacterium]